MRIHSYARLNRLRYAMAELRYNASIYSYLSEIDFHFPGDTLASLANLKAARPALGETYERLLKEDARLANRGIHQTSLAVKNNATTARQWFDSLTVVPSDEVLSGYHKYQMEPRTLGISEGTEVATLEAAFPHFEFELLVAPPVDGTNRMNSYGEIRYRYRRELLGEFNENLAPFIPFLDWTTRNFGPMYQENDNYRDRVIGIGDNGRLYGLPNARVTYYETSNIATALDPAALLATAQEQRRASIMSRMRRWRGTEPDVEAEREKSIKQAESAQRFEKYRQAQERNVDTKTMWISTLPFVEPGKGIKSSRRWGIEVETGAGRDLRGVPSEWDSKGDGSLESAYGGYRYIDPEDCRYADNHDQDEYIIQTRYRTLEDENGEPILDENGDEQEEEYEEEVFNEDYMPSWDCDYCGDVDYGDYDDDDCVELVSPILSSMHSKGLRQICEDIENSPRTDSAGVHVHVEAKDLNIRQIKELVMGYDHIERFLESSYDRRERGYCKRRSAGELLKVIRQPDVGEPKQMQTGDRYVTVNLQALYSHGTIEFRAMGPKYNYDHLIRWAMFCREMLNVVANGATSKHFAKCRSWNDVLAIFAKFGSEYNFATVGVLESENEFENIEATV